VLVVQSCEHENSIYKSNFVIREGRQHQLPDSSRHRRFIKLTFSVAEGFKALKSPVPAVSAVANSTKALIVTNHLHEALVYTNRA